MHAGIHHGLHEQEDVGRPGAGEGGRHIQVIFFLHEHLIPQGEQNAARHFQLVGIDFGRGGPHGNPFPNLGWGVGHGTHHTVMPQAARDLLNRSAGHDGEHQRIGAYGAAQAFQDPVEALGFYRKHHHLRLAGSLGVIGSALNGVFFT